MKVFTSIVLNYSLNFVLLLIFLTTWAVQSQEKIRSSFNENFSSSFVLELESAYEFDAQQLQKTELVLKPEFIYRFGKKVRFTVKGRVYGELNDHLEPGTSDENTVSNASQRVFIGDRTELELREAYFDFFLGKKGNLRIGKQQIVWGETDGLKLLDVLNPQNFREFVLDKFEDSRLPLWSVKYEFPLTKLIDVQLVWIPDLSYNIIPTIEAPYFPRSIVPKIPEGIPVQFNSIEKPDHVLKDSDIGLKLSAFIKGWDLSVNYLYHYDDLPLFYRTNTLEGIEITQKFNRQHLLGGTFNNTFGNFIFRGELAYTINKGFHTEDPLDSNGVEKTSQFIGALGLDWISGESFLSFQVFNDWLVKEIQPFNRERYELNFSFLASPEFMNDALKAELLTVLNANRGDWMLRPKVSYFLTSNLEVNIGGDFFGGDRNGLFGQFEDRNRIYLGLTLGL